MTIELKRPLDLMNIEPAWRDRNEKVMVSPQYSIADLMDIIAMFYSDECPKVLQLFWLTTNYRNVTTELTVDNGVIEMVVEQPQHPLVTLPEDGITVKLPSSSEAHAPTIRMFVDHNTSRTTTVLTIDSKIPEKVSVKPFTPFDLRLPSHSKRMKPVSKKRRQRDARKVTA